VRLLFDENLSRRLISRFADIYPDSEHVVTAGLEVEADLRVWEYAREHGLTIVTRDWDFLQLSTVRGAPPKVIWLRIGNCSLGAVEQVLRTRHLEVRRFQDDPTASLLIVD
jgi:predicted nuclease of predicted toxin-antitoxin system